jgi:hypothetical protein
VMRSCLVLVSVVFMSPTVHPFLGPVNPLVEIRVRIELTSTGVASLRLTIRRPYHKWVWWDSNPHCIGLKPIASCQLGYRPLSARRGDRTENLFLYSAPTRT